MSSSIPLLINGPSGGTATLVLAHGAGAPMDSEFMEYIATQLASENVKVVRFEFPYMSERRSGGSKRPPNRSLPTFLGFSSQNRIKTPFCQYIEMASFLGRDHFQFGQNSVKMPFLSLFLNPCSILKSFQR